VDLLVPDEIVLGRAWLLLVDHQLSGLETAFDVVTISAPASLYLRG